MFSDTGSLQEHLASYRNRAVRSNLAEMLLNIKFVLLVGASDYNMFVS